MVTRLRRQVEIRLAVFSQNFQTLCERKRNKSLIDAPFNDSRISLHIQASALRRILQNRRRAYLVSS